ncbi:MAG: pyrrolysine--tRNA(Pyl) ligase large subunit [Peptococcaceae bacterium]|nr:pyrrolysine--tRNA(Pyl) ligase large subunit [Peptococcaceae bacterium]
MEFTVSQRERLIELGVRAEDLRGSFTGAAERNKTYTKLEQSRISEGKAQLALFRETLRKPSLCLMQERLTECLTGVGFVQVATPTILSKKHLRQMSIGDDHALNDQVYWLDANHCLRPMLAPNLYYIARDLLNIWEKPIGVFEIGSCFRKESQGNSHLAEFTMLNLVEWGTPLATRDQRLTELAAAVMKAAGIEAYAFEYEDSVVYGSTLDVVCEGIEVASSSQGPHPLDAAWGITDSWVGIGFGIERLLQAKEKPNTIRAVGRSLSYLDGVRLNIK